MATKPKTRRQRDLDDVEEVQAGLERDGAEIAAQRATLHGEIALREARVQELPTLRENAALGQDADEVARLLAEEPVLSHEIEARRYMLGQLDLRAQELSSHPNHMKLQRARVALQREPCELALLRLDEALRAAEAAWIAAGQEAQALDRAGDGWGTGKLHTLRNQITNSYFFSSDGVCRPHFPQVDYD